MKIQFQRKLLAVSLMAVSAGVAIPVYAQSSGSGALALEEIVVTARRRDETLQDVPLTVNAVTSEQLDNLNIRKFEDIQGVVAGLTLQENSIAANASVRGVRFDTFASGNNPTVEFYLNDAPTSSLSAMQAMFDVGQVEVLRGPQGTLRGRASPSGSITITSQKPVLDEFGGYVDATLTDISSRNTRAAVNLPIIENMLAVRVAGFWEENNQNDVTSVFTGDGSDYNGHGYRFSVGYEPTDTLAINTFYQRIEPDRSLYFPVESANLANPALPGSDILIKDSDRYSVQDLAEETYQDLERVGLEIAWEVGGHQLNYVGSYTEEGVARQSPADMTNAIDASSRATAWQGMVQELSTDQNSASHEFRVQSIEPLFDKVDYVVGAMLATNDPDNKVVNKTPLAIFFPVGGGNYVGPVAYSVTNTNISTGATGSEELSFFGNLTYHITDATELSGGLRRIDYENDRALIVGGTKLIGQGNVFGAAGDDGQDEWQKTIYSLSLKHDFNEDLMGYVTYGTSWRPGISAVGDFSLVKSELQKSFADLEPEESDSLEIGLRSTLMEDRLRLNASVFHQEFDNYPYRSGGAGVYYNKYDAVRNAQGQVIGLATSVAQFNFVSAVPVEVNGVELEAFFQATDNWDLGALFSYAKGEIDNGVVPCNDYLPHDGVPDSGGVPTVADIQAAAGSDNLTSCLSSDRANYAPLWTTTLTSEYSFMVAGMDAYVRGMWTLYGDSDNDPTNSVDDVDAYNILNLYTGVRDPEGTWEAMLYGKNILDTEEVISREANPGSLSYTGVDAVAQGAVSKLSGQVVSDYRQIGLTAPREFGINVKYNF